MSITRRKLLGLSSLLPASLLPIAHARSAGNEQYQDTFRHMLQDDVGIQVLKTYERCLNQNGETARRNAQRLFGEAQEILLRHINEELDKDYFADGEEWNEDMLRKTAALRESRIARYIWETILSAYNPRTSS
jgi:hypothetical protein